MSVAHHTLTRDVPMWDVVVEAHEIEARRLNGESSGYSYSIERLEQRMGGPSAAYARSCVIREAHRRAGVPPWRPYLRESWPQSRVTRYMIQVV